MSSLTQCYNQHKKTSQINKTDRLFLIKPPPPVGAGGGYMFSTDFRQTFVTGASRDRDELIRFWGQKVKIQGHTIAAEAHSTRRYRRVQLFLVYHCLLLAAAADRYANRGRCCGCEHIKLLAHPRDDGTALIFIPCRL